MSTLSQVKINQSDYYKAVERLKVKEEKQGKLINKLLLKLKSA